MTRRRMAILLVALPLLAASCGGGGGDTVNCGEPGFSCDQTVGGRAFRLHVPANFKPGASALVIALHPLGSSGGHMQFLSGLDDKSDQAGFAVAYPSALVAEGTVPSWSWFFKESFFASAADDVAFLRALIGMLQGSIKPDAKKIYVTGYSNGALMTHRVGAQLSDLVAAIGVVEGSLYHTPTGPAPPVVPRSIAPISVLMVHGDLEGSANIPYCGGPGVAGALVFASQDQTFDYWAGPSANDCATLDTAAPLCDGSGALGVSAVVAKNGSQCRGGVEVKFYRLLQTRHQFFNVRGNWAQPLNNPNFDAVTGITAVDILWNFFVAHPKP